VVASRHEKAIDGFLLVTPMNMPPVMKEQNKY
jgi:hypothetical protein